MNKLKIGWSEVDITPKKGTKISLAGQFYERITDEVEGPITVTAFALDSGDEQMIICSCDLAGTAQNLCRMVKEKIKDKLPISTDKVIINAIHTHTSYVYKQVRTLPTAMSYLKTVLPKDMEYEALVSNEKCVQPDDALLFLVDKIADAILQAWANRKEGYFQCGFGRAPVGMCRRVCYDDGSAKMWGETNLANFTELEGGNDSGIELMYVYDEKKEISGVVASIACPAQVVEQRSYISSDYWGKVKENLRKYFKKDIFVLGLCSAAGDQCPRDLVRWVEPETPVDDPNIKHLHIVEHRADPSMFDISGLKVVGKRISNEIISVYEELDKSKMKNTAEFEHRTINMTFPLRKVTIAEYEDAVNKINDYIAKNRGKHANFDDNARLYVYSGICDRYNIQQTVNTFKEEIHIIRLDDIAIATKNNELFLDYGNQIKARSLAKQTFLIQLACGCGGYLPTEKAEKGSHYSAYVSSGTTGHIGGNLLVRETLENINNMFRK
ncbi:MAG: hypothetical protein MJ066_03910 [Clostridia bacterium]|nr:hypothetical protein [Clostridia bacterium]